MADQQQWTISQQLQKLDELYYSASIEQYEAMLQAAITELEYTLPGFTIAFAEIHTAGRERRLHGEMKHVFMPVERND